MPTRPPRFRAHPPRPRKERDKAYDRRRSSGPALSAARALRSSTAWVKLRKAYRAANPLCELCKRDGRTTAGTQVHHIRPVGVWPEGGLRWDNLANLCTKCHAKVSHRERRGEDTTAMFKNLGTSRNMGV